MKRKWMAVLLALTLAFGGFALAEEPDGNGRGPEAVQVTAKPDAPAKTKETEMADGGQAPEPLQIPVPAEAPAQNESEADAGQAAEPAEDATPSEEPSTEPAEQPDDAQNGAEPDPSELEPNPSDEPGDQLKDVIPDGEMSAGRADLSHALSFWQDGEVTLTYRWDEDGEAWVAQPMERASLKIYVKNETNEAIGPVRILSSASNVTDEGGLFHLGCELLDSARALVIEPGESVHIANFVFGGEGGASATACQATLSIGLGAEYEQ